MTWVAGLAEGDTDWHRFAATFPAPFEALAALVRAAWDTTDPVLLELARLRIARLLGNERESSLRSERAAKAGLTDDKLAELAQWPTSPLYDARERACLAFTEQFVIDANGIDQAMVTAVSDHLGGPGTYAFTQAVSALETFQRACLTLGIETGPGIEAMTAATGASS